MVINVKSYRYFNHMQIAKTKARNEIFVLVLKHHLYLFDFFIERKFEILSFPQVCDF